jgi:hypothetical protein
LAHYFVGGVVHDNGAIGSEGTGAALLEESFVCLVMLVREQRRFNRRERSYQSHILHTGTIWDTIDNDPGHVLVIVGYDKVRRYCGNQESDIGEIKKMHIALMGFE